MSYIDKIYYKTTYLGIDPGDDTELDRYIARASDMVDLLTDGKAADYDNLYTWQQSAIQKATAAITEYFVENGDTWNESGATSESTGGWSWSGRGSGGERVLPKNGIAFLEQADLMRASISCDGDLYETYFQ